MHTHLTVLLALSEHTPTHITSILIFFPLYFFFFLPLKIISQKDEHCWVGELNGLRGLCFLNYQQVVFLFDS